MEALLKEFEQMAEDFAYGLITAEEFRNKFVLRMIQDDKEVGRVASILCDAIKYWATKDQEKQA